MELLRQICNTYGKWKPLEETVLRIETYQDKDGAIVLESCKSLIESICRTILEDLSDPPAATESIQGLISKACGKMACLPRTGELCRSFVTVGQRLGEFRNEFAVVGHGSSVYDIADRRDKITKAATAFMIATVEQLAVFMISVYQQEYPATVRASIRYEDNPEFNATFDDNTNPIQIGVYGPYAPSEVLFSIDKDAYRTELDNYPGE